uniref:CCHC-type domain-containing protein n=1 Tax=Tanacetum cinerariifolium TaxID=118510 RepID=A0A6L2LA09_TANCI|nr:hypothetical protein [Tanacetum cinerariifolium]
MHVVAMKHMTSDFAKLDKFEGVDFIRWQKIMHFLLSSMSAVYVLTTPNPEDDGDDANIDQIRKKNKWDNDDYVCRGLILKVSINSIIESNDDIFDENKFSSVPRPSQKSLVKGTEDYGGLVVPEKVTEEIVVIRSSNQVVGTSIPTSGIRAQVRGFAGILVLDRSTRKQQKASTKRVLLIFQIFEDRQRLWRIKMHALLIQHGCEAALEVLLEDMEVQTKNELNKKAHSAVILCLGNKVLREVTRERTAAGDLVKARDFVYDKVIGQQVVPKEEVAYILSKAKGGDGKGLYVRERTDRRDSCESRGKSRSKSRGGRLKCYICQSEDHLKSNCPKNNRKKLTCYVKKDKQPSSSGSTYDDSEVMMVMAHKHMLC